MTLTADAAELYGTKIGVEQRGDDSTIGFWDNPRDWVSWKARLPRSGFYQVTAGVASANGDAEFIVEVGGLPMAARVAQTPSWDDLQTVPVGAIQIPQATELTVSVRARDASTWQPINLAFVKFERVR